MSTFKWFPRLIALLVILLFAPESSYSQPQSTCNCPKKIEIEEAVAESSLIFIGRVEDQQESPIRPNWRQVSMTVLKRFKWFDEFKENYSILIYTPSEEAKCGYKFQPGFDYLVFVTGNPARLSTTSCSRTEVLEKALLDQHRLQRLLNQ